MASGISKNEQIASTNFTYVVGCGQIASVMNLE